MDKVTQLSRNNSTVARQSYTIVSLFLALRGLHRTFLTPLYISHSLARQLSNKLSNKLRNLSDCYARKNVIVNGASPVVSFPVIVIARVVLPPINMFDGFENEYVSPPVIVMLHAGAIAIYGQPGSVPLFVTVVTSEEIENG